MQCTGYFILNTAYIYLNRGIKSSSVKCTLQTRGFCGTFPIFNLLIRACLNLFFFCGCWKLCNDSCAALLPLSKIQYVNETIINMYNLKACFQQLTVNSLLIYLNSQKQCNISFNVIF